MNRVEVGTVYRSRVEFRDPPVPPAAEGDLADPEVVTFRTQDPAAVQIDAVFPAPPVVQEDVGRFRADVLLDQPGRWRLRWEGAGDGPNVAVDEDVWVSPAFSGAPTYGATAAEVLSSYLPHRRITASSTPNTGQVEALIGDVATLVSLRVGPGLAALASAGATDARAAEYAQTAEQAAGVLVRIGAAALADDSAFPERGEVDQEDTSYGRTLWARYERGLKDLAALIQGYLTSIGTGSQAALMPYWGFPDTVARRATTTWQERW